MSNATLLPIWAAAKSTARDATPSQIEVDGFSLAAIRPGSSPPHEHFDAVRVFPSQLDVSEVGRDGGLCNRRETKMELEGSKCWWLVYTKPRWGVQNGSPRSQNRTVPTRSRLDARHFK